MSAEEGDEVQVKSIETMFYEVIEEKFSILKKI
jgi:hypothetical protein